jgi:outer membrane lipopolysaccharide assembly protein LptE/RlpB
MIRLRIVSTKAVTIALQAITRSGRRLAAGLLLALVCASGCGYRLANRNLGAGEGRTIAVPTFTNKTTTYRIEQRVTEAVRQELIRRTRFRVVPDTGGDIILSGEVLNYAAVPVIFNQQGRGSAYTMLVDLQVRLTDTKTGKIIFQNDRWTFREIFELSQSSAEFMPEDTAALDRLARRFASSLVASMMHSK